MYTTQWKKTTVAPTSNYSCAARSARKAATSARGARRAKNGCSRRAPAERRRVGAFSRHCAMKSRKSAEAIGSSPSLSSEFSPPQPPPAGFATEDDETIAPALPSAEQSPPGTAALLLPRRRSGVLFLARLMGDGNASTGALLPSVASVRSAPPKAPPLPAASTDVPAAKQQRSCAGGAAESFGTALAFGAAPSRCLTERRRRRLSSASASASSVMPRPLAISVGMSRGACGARWP